jgi:uncharacterized membrane protein
MPGSIETFTEGFFEQVPDLPPGEVAQVTDQVTLPDDLPRGKYSLAIGVVGEDSTEPVVRLAIKGRAEDGWYPLSKLTITPWVGFHPTRRLIDRGQKGKDTQ